MSLRINDSRASVSRGLIAIAVWAAATAGALAGDADIPRRLDHVKAPSSASTQGREAKGKKGRRPVRVVVRARPWKGKRVFRFEDIPSALDAAAELPEAEVLLAPGTYLLQYPLKISRGTTLLGRGRSRRPDETHIAGDCSVPHPAPRKPLRAKSVVIGPPGAPVLIVDLPDLNEEFFIANLHLVSSEGGPALRVERGRTTVARSILDGQIWANSDAASLTMRDSVLSNSAITAGDPLDRIQAPTPAKAASDMALGLPGEKIRALSVIRVRDGASFTGVGLDVTAPGPLGVTVENASAYLCGGAIHDMEHVLGERAGWGAFVAEAGSLTLEAVEMYGNSETGALADGTGTVLRLSEGSTVTDTRRIPSLMSALSVVLQNGAAGELIDMVIADNEGPGLYLTEGATGIVQGTTFTANAFAGIVVMGGTLLMDDCRISDTMSDASNGGGVGIFTENGRGGASWVEISNTAIEDNRYAGVWITGEGGTVLVSASTLRRNTRLPWGNTGSYHGNGVFAEGVVSGLTLDANAYEDNVGGHVFLHASNATLLGSTYTANGEGFPDFVQQGCGEPGVLPFDAGDLALVGLPSPPFSLELCPPYDTLIVPLSFHVELEEDPVEH